MRCPDCGARNASTSDWCTQCYRRFGVPDQPLSTPEHAPESAPALTPEATPAQSPSEPAPDAADHAPAPAEDASEQPDHVVDTGHDVRARGDEVEWRCAVCDRWNLLTEPACTACMSPRQGFGEPVGRRSSPREVGASKVLATSVLLPGLGHVLMARYGTGIARILLFLLWGLGAVGLARGASGASTLAPALVLLLGAALVWAGTLLDARALVASSSQEVLSSRALLWLVVGVTMALVAALLLAALGGVT